MFGDDDALRGDQVRGVEIFEDFRAAVVVVRRIQENKIGDEVTGGKFIESAFGVGGEYFDAAGNLQGFEILANQADGSGSRSMKKTSRAPRLMASIPMAPVPA